MAIKINKKNNVLVTGTSSADSIRNYGSKVTISAGKGKDEIDNEGDKVSISGGKGNDEIDNEGDKVLISGGDGNDEIDNEGSNVTIDGGKGNDEIDNEGDKVLISGGADNDEIENEGSKVTISGGKGDDVIKLDYYKARNTLIQYTSGDGNDIIRGFNSTSTLSIGGGAYSTAKSGKNIIVTVGKSKITLSGAASLDKINIDGTKLLNVTDKNSSPVTVDAVTKIIDASTRTTAVKITGNGLDNTIIGGSKNDSLYGRAGNDSLVGGKGNDKLYGSNGDDTLSGGKGNDTLWGDAGNDKLYGGSGKDVFIYKPDEGTDTIFDYQSGDMLKILKSDGKDGGTFTSSSFKNNKLTLAIDGGGKVIFDGVSKGDQININGTIHTISGKKLK